MPARRLLQLLAVSVILTAVFLVQSLADRTSAQGRGGRGSTPIQPGQECPAGMTETRPGTCQAPELPPPSIVDYRPHSTLVTAAHPVPKAKFPVVDFHGHPQGRLNSADSLAALMTSLDSLNVRVMISADELSGTRLQQTVAR